MKKVLIFSQVYLSMNKAIMNSVYLTVNKSSLEYTRREKGLYFHQNMARETTTKNDEGNKSTYPVLSIYFYFLPNALTKTKLETTESIMR